MFQCGSEKLIVIDKTNKVFNITFSKQQDFKSYDLSKIWQVDTTDLGYPAEDCPINKFKLCSDRLCQSNSTETWYRFRNSILQVDIS